MRDGGLSASICDGLEQLGHSGRMAGLGNETRAVIIEFRKR